MPPESGGIRGRLTSDLPMGCLQGGESHLRVHQEVFGVIELLEVARADRVDQAVQDYFSTLEATQGQIDDFISQLSCKCHQNRVASVGD